MTDSTLPATPAGLPGPAAVVATAAAAVGLISAYWDSSWHTTLGRDSAFIPPHVLLYSSIVVVGAVLALWAWRVFRRTRSIRGLRDESGLALAGFAAAATVGAAPADAFWHEFFGRDSVLWSPPHLLSVLSTFVLFVALLIGVDTTVSRGTRITMGAVLLGSSQIVILEYDTNVPQFSELLYLPLVLLTALGSAWLVKTLVGTRFAIALALGGYVALRVLMTVAFTGFSWQAPDLPVAILGLLVVEARFGRARWPLAALTITVLQVVASAVGLSSVSLVPIVQSAIAAGVLILIWLALAVGRDRQRLVGASLAGIILATVFTVFGTSTPADAHDPGQGEAQGTARVTMTGDGFGRIAVAVSEVQLTEVTTLAPTNLVARRAGIEVIGDLSRVAGSTTEFAGTLVLPSAGLWFVYAQFDDGSRPLEVWLAIEQQLTSSVSAERELYEPPQSAEIPPSQFIVGGALAAIGIGLTVWAAVAVARRRTPKRESTASLS